MGRQVWLKLNCAALKCSHYEAYERAMQPIFKQARTRSQFNLSSISVQSQLNLNSIVLVESTAGFPPQVASSDHAL